MKLIHARRLAVIAGILLLVGTSSAFAQNQKGKKKGEDGKAEGYTSLTVNIPAVTLNLTVTDKDGNLITGLTRDYFKVYEDKKEQTITNFFPDGSPVNVVLLLETSQWIQGLERDFWYGVMGFLQSLRPEDYCALVTYDMKPRIVVDFTKNKNKIASEANVNLYYKGFRESNLSDAVAFTIDRMKDVEGKKAIVLLSTGLDTFSRMNYSDALKVAESSDTVLYAISMGQLIRAVNEMGYSQVTLSEFRMADLRLRSFARKTGGEAYFPKFISEYPSIFKNISLYLRYQYTLAYRPENQNLKDEKRKIKVEAFADIDHDGKPDKLKVRCKESYRVEENAKSDKE